MFDQSLPTTKQDARRALATAMISIGRAEDPLAEFERRQANIESAMDLLGRDFSARRFMASCGFAAESVTSADEQPVIPEAAVRALRSLLTSDFGISEPALVAIDEVNGGDAEGYELTYSAAGHSGQVFAIEYRGQWVFAPGPIGREDLDAVTSASRRHFDLFVAMGLHLKGTTNEALAALRDRILPLRALWPGESDPYGKCDHYPLVFSLRNPLDNGRACYCAYNPLTDEAEPYDTDEPAHLER